ncbi:MAG: hypothetical protein AMXMBFR55_16310 [Gemmatimonadota bacterium]
MPDIVLHTGRSLLLIFSFLSLQLSLFSGGEGCRSAFAQVGGATATMAGMDMAGMDMAGMDMAVPHGNDPSDASSSHHDEQSCDDDGTSTSCDSMTVCLFAAVIAVKSIRNPQGLPTVRAPMRAVRTPPTEGDAPDLPPPRLLS